MLLAASSSGPSFSVGGWVAFVIVAGAVLSTLVGIYKVLWPIARMAMHFEETWPTLEEIATAFKPNGRPGLRDQIDSLVAGQAAAVEAVQETHEQLKEHAALDLVTAAKLADTASSLSDRVEAFEIYSHERWHELANQQVVAQVSGDTAVRLTGAVEELTKRLDGAADKGAADA